MVRELSDGDSAPMRHQVPKYVKLAMFEGKYGFLLEPVCIITGQKVEINRVRIPEKKRTLLENVYGGQETWQVQVWEYAEGYDSKTPTWMTAASEIARNHSEDGLRQAAVEIVPLNYQRGTAFGRAQIGIWEKH